VLLRASDVVVICGGISAGKYDLVRQALTQLKVREVFYKVSQKPGKPMYFGTLGKKLIFALPGNPAAVLVGFYIYILPSLRRLTGDPAPELPTRWLPLLVDFSLKSDRDLLLKATTSEAGVQILKGQDSDNLKSFAEANSLVFLKAGNELIPRGTPVQVVELPDYSR
jgi:molybdopterin molybdotransferase